MNITVLVGRNIDIVSTRSSSYEIANEISSSAVCLYSNCIHSNSYRCQRGVIDGCQNRRLIRTKWVHVNLFTFVSLLGGGQSKRDGNFLNLVGSSLWGGQNLPSDWNRVITSAKTWFKVSVRSGAPGAIMSAASVRSINVLYIQHKLNQIKSD